jgi:membrane-associated phospholipid phosphatase
VVLMFADGGRVLAVVLALCWAGFVLYSEAVRRGRVAGTAVRTGVLAALGVAVLLFGLQAKLADRISDRGLGATQLDAAVWTEVARHRTGALTAVAEVLNVAGGTLALGVFAVVAAGALLLRGRRLDSAAMVAAPAAGGLLDLGFKVGYARPRPPEFGRLVDVTGFSLPSGHTLDATIVLGTLAVVLLPTLRRRAARAGVALLAVAGVAVAGAGRVYLGVHWATDVLTGWLLGGAWVAACTALLMVLRAGGGAPSGARTPVDREASWAGLR